MLIVAGCGWLWLAVLLWLCCCGCVAVSGCGAVSGCVALPCWSSQPADVRAWMHAWHQRMTAADREAKALEEEEAVMRNIKRKKTASRSRKNKRHDDANSIDEPLVQLNSALEEKVAMKVIQWALQKHNAVALPLLNAAKHEHFIFPGANKVDLLLLRVRCVELKYATYEAFQHDLDALVAAAETTYGPSHAVVAKARELQMYGHDLLRKVRRGNSVALRDVAWC